MNSEKDEAVKTLLPKAKQGDADAQYNLGAMYAKGDGVAQDYSAALAWVRKAADQGIAEAQFGLGVMYNNGYGVPQDDAAALAWFRKAAMSGARQAEQGLVGAKRELQKLRR